MFEMYKKENDNFMEKLGWTGSGSHEFTPLFAYLIELFESK